MLDDEDVRAILRRKREIAQRTAEATRLLQERNQLENRATRLRYARKESQRVAEYKRKVAANLQKHSDMYNNSPLRHDVAAAYDRRKAKKEKEDAVEREHARIYRILESFKGTPKEDPVRLASRDVLSKVSRDPITRIELDRRCNRVDAQELSKELAIIQTLLETCLEDTRSKFPVLQDKLPASPSASKAPPVGRAALEPHNERTLFIRNDAVFVEKADEEEEKRRWREGRLG